MACQRCGGPLTGRQKQWCSDNCRKRACDNRARGLCIDCGDPLGPRSAWVGTERCRPCRFKREAAAHRLRVEDVAEMYREGMSMREIARTLGYGDNSNPHEITEAFRLGLLTDADRRYSLKRLAA